MTQLAKQSAVMIFIAIVLAVAVVGFFFADDSLAWFSQNDKVTAEGMSVTAKTSPNLVIGKTAQQVASGDLCFSVDFAGTEQTNMIAVTRDASVPGTYLKYLTNHYAVDNMTGNVKDGMALEFAPVPTTDNARYFVEHTVYIASAFYELAVSSLSATITLAEEIDDDHLYFGALSIDFYVETVDADGYCGTISVADCLDPADPAAVELMPGGGTIPLNTEGQIKIIMRCYFDGALQNTDTNTAYVNSYAVRTDDIAIGVAFTAVDAVTATP